MSCHTLPFREVWAVDFEFTAPPGERPRPLCLVGRELRAGRLVRHWLADGPSAAPPWPAGDDVLFVAYFASAELGCLLALDWPTPRRILDLYAEFRRLTCGRPGPCGNGLLGALAYFGLPGMAAAEKDDRRQLAIRGGPFTEDERAALLDYCGEDVDALARLLPAMLPSLDLPRALLRGRYMAAVARMEWAGVPIDVDALARLRESWDRIKGRLIADIDRGFGVFVPADGRALDPGTAYGAAVLREAQAAGLDPDHLADAVDWLWAEERAAAAASREALARARKATGLTPARIGRWEAAGLDYSTWPGLDTAARELAGALPELGIGRGYDPDAPDEDDHAGRLWDRLREPVSRSRPRHDPALVRQAAELLTAAPAAPAAHRPMRFSSERWAAYLARRGIPWPRLESGALALDDDTFREMARTHPAEVGPIRELRHALSQLRLNALAVGADGRNRLLLSPFGTITGRNSPSNSRFIFGPSTWLRSLIRPGPGRAVAYVDWSGQELGVAAALSGDKLLQEAYRSGDPHLWWAKRVGAVPPDATKESHPAERERFKVVGLGVMYGMSGDGLARRLAIPPCHGRELLRLHQETFRDFWTWANRVEVEAMLSGRLQTVFGWALQVGPDARPTSLRNFPVQANAAEMMRLAACLLTERGITVCCPVHDAFLVEGPADGIEAVVRDTQAAMREASELVLPGFPLRSDAKIVRHPDRYADGRGRAMWDTVWRLLESDPTPITGDRGPLSPVIPPPSLLSLSTYVPPCPTP